MVRRTGLPQLSYQGVEAASPPEFSMHNRPPVSGTVGKDIKNFNISHIWLDTSAGTPIPYMLVDKAANIPTWSAFASDGGGATDFVTDAGTATEVGGTINVLGGELIGTTGSGQDVTVNLDRGTNGQIIIAASSAASMYGSLTSTGGTITVTGGANTLNIDTAGSVPISFAADSGTATPSLGVITMAGGTNLVSSASGSTVTFDLNGTTDHAVQVGNSSNALTSLGVGTNGQVLIAATAADPSFATITSTGGTISFTLGANSLNLEATASALFPWTEVTAATQTMSVNNGYVANRVTAVSLTLPTTAALGDRVAVVGSGSGGWIILQNAGESINIDGGTTTVGVGGSLASTVRYDCIELICITANNTWSARSVVGNITIV